MKRFRHLLSPYSLTLILPVVIAALLINELLGWRSRQAAPRIQTLSAQNEPALHPAEEKT